VNINIAHCHAAIKCSLFLSLANELLNKRVWPLRGRPLWGRPCSWVRACCFGSF